MSASLATAPSGFQYEISLGNQRAVVTEVGATLRSYAVDGVDVLDGFDVSELSSAGRGQILAPWPNRLEDGRYTRYGKEGRAALDEPERAVELRPVPALAGVRPGAREGDPADAGRGDHQ